MRQRTLATFGASALILFAGCGRGNSAPGQKPTFKVTGQVTVDGNVPEPPVQIVCYPQISGGGDATPAVLPSCMSKEDGTFSCTTYRDGDGAPAGDYRLTVTWREIDQRTRKIKPKDKLNGRYSDAKKSEIKFTVTNKAVDLGHLVLTTK